MKKELDECLHADGFTSVQDAIGADHPDLKKKLNAPKKGLLW